MNKADLVAEVSKKTGMTQQEVTKVLESTIETIMATVKANKKVTLVGFGTFEIRERKARRGVNPRSGQPMTIPAARVPKFSAGKAFKEMIE